MTRWQNLEYVEYPEDVRTEQKVKKLLEQEVANLRLQKEQMAEDMKQMEAERARHYRNMSSATSMVGW